VTINSDKYVSDFNWEIYKKNCICPAKMNSDSKIVPDSILMDRTEFLKVIGEADQRNGERDVEGSRELVFTDQEKNILNAEDYGEGEQFLSMMDNSEIKNWTE
jgi:hypothetical protein